MAAGRSVASEASAATVAAPDTPAVRYGRYIGASRHSSPPTARAAAAAARAAVTGTSALCVSVAENAAQAPAPARIAPVTAEPPTTGRWARPAAPSPTVS